MPVYRHAAASFGDAAFNTPPFTATYRQGKGTRCMLPGVALLIDLVAVKTDMQGLDLTRPG
ncbi:hypothetical protein RCH06_001096 [Polaromonas sp. CG_9.5]|nr:hypothetical protein [Polaromonas sp. CG_9.5]